METSDNIEKEPYIDDGIGDNAVVDEVVDDEANVDAEPTTEEMDETIAKDSEEAKDTDEITPVFERDGWREMVDKFEEEYPISRELSTEIGDVILKDEHLWNDTRCLEKALLDVLSKKYTPDEVKAHDEDFLQTYIYSDEDIRGKIVDEYMESLDRQRMPSTITRGGKISLARPAKPRTIQEAGYIAEKIMKR